MKSKSDIAQAFPHTAELDCIADEDMQRMIQAAICTDLCDERAVAHHLGGSQHRVSALNEAWAEFLHAE